MSNQRDPEFSELSSNPARVRILEIIGSRGSATFTEIKRETGLSTGSVYYHLSRLRNYVEQSPDRKYVVTEMGRNTLEKLGTVTLQPMKRPFAKQILMFAGLIPVTRKAAEKTMYLVVGTALILLASAYIFSNTKYNLVLLAVPARSFIDPALSTILTGWLLLFLLGAGFAALTGASRTGGEPELLFNTTLALIPLDIYSALSNTDQELAARLVLPLQLWSALLLATGLNTSRGVKLAYSALFALAVTYISVYIWWIYP